MMIFHSYDSSTDVFMAYSFTGFVFHGKQREMAGQIPNAELGYQQETSKGLSNDQLASSQSKVGHWYCAIWTFCIEFHGDKSLNHGCRGSTPTKNNKQPSAINHQPTKMNNHQPCRPFLRWKNWMLGRIHDFWGGDSPSSWFPEIAHGIAKTE